MAESCHWYQPFVHSAQQSVGQSAVQYGNQVGNLQRRENQSRLHCGPEVSFLWTPSGNSRSRRVDTHTDTHTHTRIWLQGVFSGLVKFVARCRLKAFSDEPKFTLVEPLNKMFMNRFAAFSFNELDASNRGQQWLCTLNVKVCSASNTLG